MVGITDTGERIDYGEGKAVREPSKGKGRYDLITPYGWYRISRWYELGAEKYADRNWEKGIPFSRYVDSALRHINKFMRGLDDEDHLAAAVWNLMSIMHHQERGEFHLDDMPHYEGMGIGIPGHPALERAEEFAKLFKDVKGGGSGVHAHYPTIHYPRDLE